MERDKANSATAAAAADERGGGGEAPGCVNLMTDEQIEVLRKQISIYTILCERLLEMYDALCTADQNSAAE